MHTSAAGAGGRERTPWTRRLPVPCTWLAHDGRRAVHRQLLVVDTRRDPEQTALDRHRLLVQQQPLGFRREIHEGGAHR